MPKKKKPDFLKTPPKECLRCGGRGEVKDQYITRFLGSSTWTYKKCPICEGSGKNTQCCIECGELLAEGLTTYCLNQNCKRFGLYTATTINDK
jgi:hypothetical protein